jgi:hypothetical protein
MLFILTNSKVPKSDSSMKKKVLLKIKNDFPKLRTMIEGLENNI